MLLVQTAKPSPSVVPAHATVPASADGAGADPSRPVCNAHSGCLLRDGAEVTLKFAADLQLEDSARGRPRGISSGHRYKRGRNRGGTKGRARGSDGFDSEESWDDGEAGRPERAIAIFDRGQQSCAPARNKRQGRREQNRRDGGTNCALRAVWIDQARKRCSNTSGCCRWFRLVLGGDRGA